MTTNKVSIIRNEAKFSDYEKRLDLLYKRISRLELFAVLILIFLVIKPITLDPWQTTELSQKLLRESYYHVENVNDVETKESTSLEASNVKSVGKIIEEIEDVSSTPSLPQTVPKQTLDSNENGLNIPSNHSKRRGIVVPPVLELKKRIFAGKFDQSLSSSLSEDTKLFDEENLKDRMPVRKLQAEEVESTCDGVWFRLDILLDFFPTETSWELVEAENNSLVASASFVSNERNTMKTFTKCIAVKLHRFTVFDSWGDGLKCTREGGCYEIYLDNERIIEGPPFVGTGRSHIFDPSATCPYGSSFIFRSQPDLNNSGIILQLNETISKTTISYDFQSMLNEGLTSSFSACLSPGLYSFDILHTEENRTFCVENEDCFNISINGDLLIQRDSNLIESSFIFSIANDGTATFCNEGSLYHLNVILDEFPTQTTWNLINTETNVTVANETYKNYEIFVKQHFGTCIGENMYDFTLFDSGHDGLICGDPAEPTSCYSIYIDNELLKQGFQFSGSMVSETFNPSSICPIDNIFVFEPHYDYDGLNVTWQLLDATSSEEIALSPFTPIVPLPSEERTTPSVFFPMVPLADPDVKNTSSYFACLPPGLYSFVTSQDGSEGTQCENDGNCNQIFINDKLLTQGTFSLYNFVISLDGIGREQICPMQPRITPSLSSDESKLRTEVKKKLDVIGLFSAHEALHNSESPQYKAACLILFDDIYGFPESEDFLIERYALSVFHFTTGLESEVVKSCNFGNFSAICDSEGYVRKLLYSKFVDNCNSYS